MADQEKPKLRVNLPPSLRKRPQNVNYQDNEALKLWPLLVELLTPTWDEHNRMTWEPAMIRVTVRQGTLHATLVCPTAMQQLTCQAASLTRLMDAIERALGTEPVNWEPTFEAVKLMKRDLDKKKQGMDLTGEV